MTKVHPNLNAVKQGDEKSFDGVKDSGEPAVLTVWRKSLVFNGYGFTVFDPRGNLLFRVDNYASESKGEIVLMDASGKPLLTIRRKKLSLGENWSVYDGEGTEVGPPRFSARKHVSPLPTKALAHVTAGPTTRLQVEGSYSRRSCGVFDSERRQVAAVRRKEAAAGGGASFGSDVFRLVVEPGFDPALAMAIVILLDQMFKS